MAVSKVKYRRPLNSEQLDVLKLLYSYRFGTVELATKYLGKVNSKVVQKKLKILEDQQYIAKRYDKSYKLVGRPAEYYVTPKGARTLKARQDSKTKLANQVTEQGIKNLYKNSSVSEDFMAHCLNILKVNLLFTELYGDKLQLFTRMQMIPFGYLPTWRPDLFLSLKQSTNSKVEPKRFFLDIWDGTRPFFVSVRKARSYITYFEEGDWPTDEYDLPIMLALCNNKKDETKLRRQIRKALEDSYERTIFATTTIDEFVESKSTTEKLWQTIAEYSEDDKHYSLSNLFKSIEVE